MNDDAATRLIPRYRQRGLLLDTNLLLVWLIGQYNPAWIGNRRRLREFSSTDWLRLQQFVGQFDRLVTTPTILGEVSNLAVYAAYDHERVPLFALFQRLIAVLTERHPRSTDVADMSAFGLLGLPDATIEHVAQYRRAFVLSDDLDLVRHLQSRDLAALNFNHLRRPSP